MTAEKATCSIVFVSSDMEWINAFSKGIQRFFTLHNLQADSLARTEEILANEKADLVVLAIDQDMPAPDKVRALLQKSRQNAALLVIAGTGEKIGDYLRQGADLAVARPDLLGAIRYVQQLMQLKSLEQAVSDAQMREKSVNDLYQRIYSDLPDPVCYLQDGIFLDANPSFVKKFKVANQEALEEMTIMNFVPLKSEKALKQLMKLALQKNVVPAEPFVLEDSAGEKLEMMVQAAQVQFNGEPAIQMYFRGTDASGSTAGGLDPTTGLASALVLKASIAQSQKRSEEGAFLGVWIYFLVENYREVFQKDGYDAAEILIRSVTDMARRLLPPSTEMVRFSDDALLLWVSGDKEQTIQRFEKLIASLDEFVPDNIGRLVHPHTFAGMQELREDSDFDTLLSKSYRAVCALAIGQTQERIAEPASAEMSRNDERRVYQINQILENNRISLRYQPICALKPDGVPRYGDHLDILDDPEAVKTKGEDEKDQSMELDILLQVADRYQLGRQIQRMMFSRFQEDFLSYNGDQSALEVYLSILTDALEDHEFPKWISTQLDQTGISPKQLVFELKLDAAHNSFSGASRLVDEMRPRGSKIALSEIARMDDEVIELLTRIKPDVLKLNLREIDTFEADEEERFMKAMKNYAAENAAMLIAEHMESPAQLSRIWPYNINYLQGEGMVDALRSFSYDFTKPLF